MKGDLLKSFAMAVTLCTLLVATGGGWFRLAAFLAGIAAPFLFILAKRALSKAQTAAALVFLPAAALLAAGRGWRLFLTYVAGVCTMAGAYLVISPARAEKK